MDKQSVQTRSFTFDIEGARASGDSIPVVISSDAVVEVHDGPEILVHTTDAIDLSRAPLPIIATHRSGQVNVGIIDNLEVRGGRLHGTAAFGTRPEAAGYREDVVNRIIRSVSVGYARVKAMLRKDGVLITSRWMPTHTALVAEPADINAGFFRSLETVPDFHMEVEASLSISSTDSKSRAASGHQRDSGVRLITPGVSGTKRADGAVLLIPRKPNV